MSEPGAIARVRAALDRANRVESRSAEIRVDDIAAFLAAAKALEPFADAATHLHPSHADHVTTLDGLTVASWRRAANAWEKLRHD